VNDKMLKNYYYRLLSRYISIYARSGDKVLFVEPKSRIILGKLPTEDVLIVTNRPELFNDYRAVEDIQKAKQWEADYIILDGNLHTESDIIEFLKGINSICTLSTRVILTYYSALWKPIVKLATILGLRERVSRENWTAPEDVFNFARLTEFERVKRQPRILVPVQIPFFSNFINRWLAPLPILNFFSFLNFEILRPIPASNHKL